MCIRDSVGIGGGLAVLALCGAVALAAAGVITLPGLTGSPAGITSAPPAATEEEIAGPTDGLAEALTEAPTEPPTSDATEKPPTEASPPPDDEIEQAVLAFDEGMRYILETGDTTRISSVAAGKALDDRLNAASILLAAGNCHWDYDHRGLYVEEIAYYSETRAWAMALVDRGGTVRCPDGERPQYAFEGPYNAIYIVEWLGGRWIVTDYCSYNDCPPEMQQAP